MANLFNTELQIHRKFDLKGSTEGRTAGVVNVADTKTVLKDLDLDIRLLIEPSAHAHIVSTLAKDALFLKQVGSHQAWRRGTKCQKTRDCWKCVKCSMRVFVQGPVANGCVETGLLLHRHAITHSSQRVRLILIKKSAAHRVAGNGCKNRKWKRSSWETEMETVGDGHTQCSL